ncbi:hypothetical protein [Streptomyces mangrovisoli]|uniref:DUF2867 domain-containing protein n=1 Tax=Streptomyces mangrovisoli TaxID=1428628 RepID=A0A1J4P3A7_9ACTN|nr:hypothetical protein [Streptomyces mangrovisoli]OIJ67926.1 hypothetical protein WN71_010250 [Streptomyces mangrovisoli]
MGRDPLPYIDQHATHVAASRETTWRALTATVATSFSGRGAAAYARLVGCTDRAEAGPRPPAEGSVLPGFHVARAVPPHELVLRGTHRFSTYQLAFFLGSSAPDGCSLTAESHATFPGVHGRGYRILVLGTGAHAAGLRRLLAAVRRHAERADGPGA